MRRIVVLCLILIGGLFIVGFSDSTPLDLRHYSRLPLSVRISRLENAGREFYRRRRFENAIDVFKAVRSLDPKNLGALMWIKKCEERLFRERNMNTKAEIYRKYGGLTPRDLIYNNWVWGPTVGHFEVKYSKPKPYIPPVRKVRPPATDDQLDKAQLAAAGDDPASLFELAMVHWSRKNVEPALDAIEKAVNLDPAVLGSDDEDFLGTIQTDLLAKLEVGSISSDERLQLGRVALIQGDIETAIEQLILAASKDEKSKPAVQARLQQMVMDSRLRFLQSPPQVFSFHQAYVFEENEDRLYVHLNYAPVTPFRIVPIELLFEPASLKSIEVQSPDILFVLPDPGATDTARLWLVTRNKGSAYPNYNVKIRFHFNKDKIEFLELSNYFVAPDLPENWSTVIGPIQAFNSAFPLAQEEKVDNGVRIAGFKLQITDGKGPIVNLQDFRTPLPEKLDVWKIMKDVSGGRL